GPVRGADDRRRGRPLRPRSPAAVRGLAAAHLQRRIADRQRARAAGAGVGVDAARADAARQSGVRAQRRARARLSAALIRSQRLPTAETAETAEFLLYKELLCELCVLRG